MPMDYQRQGFVYILSNNRGNVLYTGVTNNLARRMHEHRNKLVDGFTAKYNVTKLVYYETHLMIIEAITREKMIKKKSRKGKVFLIESENQDWRDLYLDL
jgi:putative endonuclease